MRQSDVRLWYIYLVENCVHTTPIKIKFVIIACLDERPMGFLINSAINDFIINRPNLSACQAAITGDEHRILKRNSYVDCSNIYPFDDWELRRRHDAVSANAKYQLVRAVGQCLILPRRYKNLILMNEAELWEQIQRDLKDS